MFDYNIAFDAKSDLKSARENRFVGSFQPDFYERTLQNNLNHIAT